MLPPLSNLLQSLIPGPRSGPMPTEPPKVALLIRTDMFGDQVVFGGMIQKLRLAWPKTRLFLVTTQNRKHLYEPCSALDEVIYFDWKEAGKSAQVRAELFARIRATNPDFIINSQFTRSLMSDRIVRYCHARVRLGVTGHNPQMKNNQRDKFDPYYTHLLRIPDFQPTRTEVNIIQSLLEKLGIPSDNYRPHIWTTPADIAFAEKTFQDSGFDPSKTFVCFSGSSSKLRAYPQLNQLLGSLLREGPWNVITVGGPSEHAQGEPPDESLRPRWLNLCGGSTIRESAELMRRCRLVLGVETGLAQVASAVGAQQVILQSGAYFGRFLSSDPNISLAIQPTDCYFCHGECPWDQAYCLTHIPPTVFRHAIDDALAGTSSKTRIYFGEPSPSLTSGNLPHPKPKWDADWIDSEKIEVIKVPATT